MSTQQTTPCAEAQRTQQRGREQRGTPDGAERRANGLGWFSLGLGIAQIAVPRVLARAIGIRDDRKNRKLMRAIGSREIAAGIGILTRSRPAGWVWARVA